MKVSCKLVTSFRLDNINSHLIKGNVVIVESVVINESGCHFPLNLINCNCLLPSYLIKVIVTSRHDNKSNRLLPSYLIKVIYKTSQPK